MKIAILALIALAIGVSTGFYITWREFAGERLPTKMVLAVLKEKDAGTVPGQGPKVVVDGGEIFDFGTMDRGSSGKHDFIIRNAGTEPLVLTMGDTTCKCTAMTSGGKAMMPNDQESLAPGATFKVTLEWRIKVTDKDFSQSAEFRTNDPRREIVRLLIHGRTVDAIETSQSAVTFPTVSANEPAVSELVIYSHREQPLQFVKYDWENVDSKDFLDVSFEPLAEEEAIRAGARGGLRMQVKLKPGLPLGRTMQRLSLTSNYEGIEPLVIPVEMRIVGDITLVGSRIRPGTTMVVLGSVPKGQGMTHTVFLLIKGPHRDSTSIEKITVQPESSLKATLGTAITTSPTVKRIPIILEIPSDAPPGNYLGTNESKTGRVVITTNHPQVKQITIPVLFLVE